MECIIWFPLVENYYNVYDYKMIDIIRKRIEFGEGVTAFHF